MEIIAIAYTFAEENGNVSLLRKTPPQPQTYIPHNNEKNESKEDSTKHNKEMANNKNDDSHNNDKKDDQNKNAKSDENEKQNNNEIKNINIPEEQTQKQENQIENNFEDIKNDNTLSTDIKNKNIDNHENELSTNKDNQSDSEDDEAGWINPDNISKHIFNSVKVEETENKIGVAIMTADYAMQVNLFKKIKNKLLFFLFRMLFYKSEFL